MKQSLNEQLTRMQKLAGIITENQYLKLINEDKFNALDSSAPDWEDSEGYELLLDSYFNSYNLEDPKEFAYEIYENGDAINDLAFEIAQRGGFKGSLTDLLNDNTMKDFNIYCNNLAKLFFLEHGVAMDVIDKNDAEYQKQVQETNKVITTYEPKIQSVLVKLQGNTNEISTGQTDTGQKGVINDYQEKFSRFEQDNIVKEYSNNFRGFLQKYTDDDADRENLLEGIKSYYKELINKIK